MIVHVHRPHCDSSVLAPLDMLHFNANASFILVADPFVSSVGERTVFLLVPLLRPPSVQILTDLVV